MVNYNLHGADANHLKNWHAKLDEQRGLRAQLRRIDRPEDVLLTEAFALFLQRMPAAWRHEDQLMASALVAAVLSWVVQDMPNKRFAQQLKKGSQERSDSDRAFFSEMRFQQLLKSRTTEEFYRRLLRAIRMLKGQVNILSLTADILQWYQEFNCGPDRNPVDRLAVKWARDYYAA